LDVSEILSFRELLPFNLLPIYLNHVTFLLEP
jgi:hypothetical protein